MRSPDETPTPTPILLTVRQFAEKHGAFSQGSLRRLIFDAEPRHCTVDGRSAVIPGNGLAVAIVRIGRRVLIDERLFFAWLGKSSGASASGPQPVAQVDTRQYRLRRLG
jgi:hypothetical protein